MNGKRLFPALSDGAGLFPGYLQDLLGQFLVLSRTPEDSGMLNTDYLLGRVSRSFSAFRIFMEGSFPLPERSFKIFRADS